VDTNPDLLHYNGSHAEEPSEDDDIGGWFENMIGRDALERLVNQVNELYADRLQMRKALTELSTRMNYVEDRVSTSRRDSLTVDLSDFEFDDSPTGHHRHYRIPKAEIRAEINAMETVRDAQAYRGIKAFFKKNTVKMLGYAFTSIITFALAYIAHKLHLLP